MAADVCEDFGLQTKLADGLTVEPRLLGGGGGGKFDVFDTEGIKSLGDSNFGLGIEKGVSELFSLYK